MRPAAIRESATSSRVTGLLRNNKVRYLGSSDQECPMTQMTRAQAGEYKTEILPCRQDMMQRRRMPCPQRPILARGSRGMPHGWEGCLLTPRATLEPAAGPASTRVGWCPPFRPPFCPVSRAAAQPQQRFNHHHAFTNHQSLNVCVEGNEEVNPESGRLGLMRSRDRARGS